MRYVNGLLSGSARSGSENPHEARGFKLGGQEMRIDDGGIGFDENDTAHQAERPLGVDHTRSTDRCASTDDQDVASLGVTFLDELVEIFG